MKGLLPIVLDLDLGCKNTDSSKGKKDTYFDWDNVDLGYRCDQLHIIDWVGFFGGIFFSFFVIYIHWRMLYKVKINNESLGCLCNVEHMEL